MLNHCKCVKSLYTISLNNKLQLTVVGEKRETLKALNNMLKTFLMRHCKIAQISACEKLISFAQTMHLPQPQINVQQMTCHVQIMSVISYVLNADSGRWTDTPMH